MIPTIESRGPGIKAIQCRDQARAATAVNEVQEIVLTSSAVFKYMPDALPESALTHTPHELGRSDLPLTVSKHRLQQNMCSMASF